MKEMIKYFIYIAYSCILKLRFTDKGEDVKSRSFILASLPMFFLFLTALFYLNFLLTRMEFIRYNKYYAIIYVLSSFGLSYIITDKIGNSSIFDAMIKELSAKYKYGVVSLVIRLILIIFIPAAIMSVSMIYLNGISK